MLAWKIAVRYLFSKKSHGAVNIISAISVVGVAVATMAITIVLSVYNGFSEVASTHLAILDPEIKVTAIEGKVVEDADSIVDAVSMLPEVESALPVLEERALALYGNTQMPVMIKGIPEDYGRVSALDSVIVAGERVESAYGIPAAQISPGVATRLMANPGLEHLLEIYVPRRVGRINPANPAASFSKQDFLVSGVFQIGQSEYDAEYVFLPLEYARELLEYDTEATAIEIKLRDGSDAVTQAAAISAVLGRGYRVETRLQQKQESLRMISVEKWITFLMLSFILVVASFNIISTLSLLVIEKRRNMETLRALGAPRSLVRRIFLIQGWLISVIGGIAGIILGTLLALVQQCFHLIRLNGDPSQLIIPAYPVKVEATDLLAVFLLVVVVGFATSQITRLFTRRI